MYSRSRRLTASTPGLRVCVLVLVTTLVTACGSEPDPSGAERPGEGRGAPGSDAVADSRKGSPEGASQSQQGPFARALARKHRAHRNVEGREGILAEEKRYSNFDEELIIRDFFQDRRDGFYLDVGCAKAVEGSNTYYLEEHLGWTGIGVDALQEYAPEWAEKRPRSRFVQVLVSDESDATEKFYKSYGRGISSTDKEWASGQAFGVEFPTEEVETRTITLDDLLDRAGVTKIDLLSMDIEGHEPKALAGFDIERFQPELVVIERQTKKAKNQGIADYFERHGYARIEKYRAFDKVNDYYQRAKP